METEDVLVILEEHCVFEECSLWHKGRQNIDTLRSDGPIRLDLHFLSWLWCTQLVFKNRKNMFCNSSAPQIVSFQVLSIKATIKQLEAMVLSHNKPLKWLLMVFYMTNRNPGWWSHLVKWPWSFCGTVFCERSSVVAGLPSGFFQMEDVLAPLSHMHFNVDRFWQFSVSASCGKICFPTTSGNLPALCLERFLEIAY